MAGQHRGVLLRNRMNSSRVERSRTGDFSAPRPARGPAFADRRFLRSVQSIHTPSPDPLRKSDHIVVPAAVPSVVQSSNPVAPSVAVNQSLSNVPD